MPHPGRLSGTLPLSIAVHGVALVLFIVVPLTSGMDLPQVPVKMASYVAAVAIPAPPPVAPAPAFAQRAVSLADNAAPATPPEQINPEIEPSGPTLPDLPVGPISGSPDLGAVVDGTGRFVPPPPPPTTRQSGPVRVSELVTPPRKVVDVRPVYPDVARQARVEGTVILEAILDQSGHVDKLRVVRSVPLLDLAAMDAVRQWRYTPTVLNGQPVPVLMTITIRFTLQ
jgi:protein TonB